MSSNMNLQDTLQAEFCPPLDTSLVAAFLGEYDGKQLSAADLSELRETLSALASQAEYQALADSFSPRSEPTPSLADSSSAHTPDFANDTTDTSVSFSSDFSGSPIPIDSPLSFLQAAFPDVGIDRLRRELAAVGGEDADLETVVSGILTSEYIRELEERGLDDDNSFARADDEAPWITVESRKSPVTKAEKKPKPRTIQVIGLPQSQSIRKEPISAGRPAPDPWIQLNSLATRLADLLPAKPPPFFLSLFHNPSYNTLAKAVRAALANLASTYVNSDSDKQQVALFTLLEVLTTTPIYQSLDAEQRAVLISDAQLALSATHGRPDEALDIVWLLSDLDNDESGVQHAPVSPVSSMSGRPAAVAASKSPISPTLRAPTTPISPAKARESSGEWQYIPERRTQREANPHAQFIPAYDPLRGSRKLRGMGNGLGKGGKGDVGELPRGGLEKEAERSRRRVAELKAARNEALRDATQAWQRGNTKSHGGEIAMFFAERARGLQEQMKEEALAAARNMVHSRRVNGKHEVDLHNTTSSEAIIIVKEILATERCSQANPLMIITGKGRHSANGVGVLGPAVRNALVTDGWNVSTWDGGLVVRGRR